MFGLFKKGSDTEDDKYESVGVTTHYEGGVISADYAAETLDRSDINEQSYPYHMLVPNGQGKIVYKSGDVVLEQYEGEFEAGQYQGKGTLIDRHGEVHEGEFKANLFIG
jgi:hypothetical protein